MTTTAPPCRRFSPLAVILFPLRLLERSRGWRRRLLVLVYLLVGIVGGVLIWRVVSLNSLPDVGEPFDVTAFLKTAQVPADRDAAALYRQARERMEVISTPRGIIGSLAPDWSRSSPEDRQWLETARPAMMVWRDGTTRSDAMPMDPTNFRRVWAPHVPMFRWVMLESSHLESQGDLAGAWGWHEALLRSFRHGRTRSPFVHRTETDFLEGMSRPRLLALINSPKISRDLLQTMLDRVLAEDAATPPLSENFKIEYLLTMEKLQDPESILRSNTELAIALDDPYLGPWTRLLFWLKRDPERAQRVIRLGFANQMAQCDRPASQRAAWVGNSPTAPVWIFYQPDPTVPDAARALAPEEYFRWAMTSWLTSMTIPMTGPAAGNLPDVEAEHAGRASIILALADQLYYRDHGRFPAQNTDLLGKYLKTLPSGTRLLPPADERHPPVESIPAPEVKQPRKAS